MGIDNATARMILLVKGIPGVNLQNALTLGHQRNYIGLILRNRISKDFSIPIITLKKKYGDDFLAAIGMENLDTLDVSNYEDATVIHDLNFPIPDSLRQKYSLVMDIGTVEHVFDVAHALKNLRDLCMIGGHVVMVSPADKWLGHGFYQFSPELFFRAFDDQYGFKVLHVYLIQKRIFGESWFELSDPSKSGRRGFIQTRRRCQVAAVAVKTAQVDAPEIPQQSDYLSAWNVPQVTRAGALYLKMPTLVRLILDRTVMRILMRYRNRLKRVRFKWEGSRLSAE